MLSIVPVIVIGAFFSSDIDRSHQEQLIMNEAVNKTFFEGDCSYGAVCEDEKIFLEGKNMNKEDVTEDNLYEDKIYIRKSSSLFKSKESRSSDNALGDGAGEFNDGVLDDLYEKLEKATEANTGE